MLRRFVIALSVVAMLGALTATQAGAKPSPVRSKAVCGVSHSATYAQCFARVVTDSSGRAKVSPNVSGYGPLDWHTGYNLPNTVAGNHTIAIVDAFSNPNVFADLKVYNATMGLPKFPKCTATVTTKCIAILNQLGKKKPLPPTDSGWGLEIALDVQTAHAVCQNCRINLYEANDNSFANLGAAVNKAAAQGADAISNSYGAFGFDCGTQPAYNHTKIAVTVSTGDSGFGIACPANQNTVVAVGGTTLNLNGSHGYVSESAWSGGGSGCSTVISAQSWQLSATNWAAIGCGTKRGMADVSADANPSTGAAVYDTFGFGGWLVVGGTSLSAPLIAGVYALAGNVTTWNYPAQSVYLSPGSLHDVTTGSNGSGGTCTTHPLQCHAGVGYDLPTGIGTPNGLGGF
jgi:subtilase family serine protease